MAPHSSSSATLCSSPTVPVCTAPPSAAYHFASSSSRCQIPTPHLPSALLLVPICEGLFMAPTEAAVMSAVVAPPLPNRAKASLLPFPQHATSHAAAPLSRPPCGKIGAVVLCSSHATPAMRTRSSSSHVRFFTVFAAAATSRNQHEDEDVQCFFDPAVEFIQENQALGVHVLIGTARDPVGSAVAIAFLVKAHGWMLDRAVRHVVVQCGCMAPGANLLAQLIEYAQGLGRCPASIASLPTPNSPSAEALAWLSDEDMIDDGQEDDDDDDDDFGTNERGADQEIFDME